MSIDELENAITELSEEEMARFGQWFDQYRADQWDRQIEADIRAGKLDEAGRRADADFEGRSTTLRPLCLAEPYHVRCRTCCLYTSF